MSMTTPAFADRFDAGVVAYQSGLYAEAAKIWLDLAQRDNHASAQYNLGLLYEQGLGVEKNLVAAARWYRAAALQSFPDAEYNLGGLYYRGEGVSRSIDEAVHWWVRAAQQGYAAAQYTLGILLLRGKEVPQNVENGKKWLQLAANHGHIGAVRVLGVLEHSKDASAATAGHDTNTAEARTAGVLTDIAWIRRRDPANFTVSLHRAESADAAAAFIRRHRIETVATYYPHGDRYVVIGGVFQTLDDANAAIEKLSPELQRGRPVVRTFKAIQAELPPAGGQTNTGP